MSRSAAIALIAWPFVVLLLFRFLSRTRAASAAFVIAWLFLPDVVYPIAGVPDVSKLAVTCASALLGVCVFDFRKLISLRPQWVDAPIVLFCFSPFASAMRNGLGIHEGFSAVFAQCLAWGVPYAIGRLYFGDFQALRELAAAIFAGGAVYVPICLFELWSGVELRRVVYGLTDPNKVVSFGIVRPSGFMLCSLMLALWMAAATVIAIWLWRTGTLPVVRGIRPAWMVTAMIGTVILFRSVNGWVELLAGAGLLLAGARFRTAAPMMWAILLMVAYLAVRAAGLWSGDQVVYAVQHVLNEQKMHSIQYRFQSEDVIGKNTRERPVFGWGRQTTPFFMKYVGLWMIPDSLWINVFANFGIAGLLGFVTSILGPAVLFTRRFPADSWSDATVGPAAALAVVLVVYMIDHMANAMIIPVFMVAAGGLAGVSIKPSPQVAAA